MVGRDILKKIVLEEPSMFRDKGSRHRVINSQSLKINLLD